jgi:protein-arginine kinase activator protein McsA
MKEKRDCKNCGVPLKEWQVKQGYDLCLECYKDSKKTIKTPLKQ